MEEAMPLLSDGLSNRDFDQGKKMFAASLCSSCHMMQGEGGSIGPDLSQLGTRFTERDILDNTINPSKEVSDQYAATIFSMKDGSSILGRLTNEDDEKFYISQNPFAPQVSRAIAKDEVISTKLSQVSLMLPGLVNRLNEEELKDLLAYLVAGGNKDDKVYSGDGATSKK
jgi:putative heme-binding domain-containing protein